MTSIEELVDRMAATVRQHVARALDPITSRLSAVETRVGALAMMRADGGSPDALRLLGDMEARIKLLEARPQMRYHGIWAESYEHQPGDLVTHAGSMWYCWRATGNRPGTDDAWQLCVKRGRDAR